MPFGYHRLGSALEQPVRHDFAKRHPVKEEQVIADRNLGRRTIDEAVK